MTTPAPDARAVERPRGFSAWDVLAALILLGLIVLLAQATRHAMQPLPVAPYAAITLDPGALPDYAARTTLRMLAAMALSLVFTLTYATLAAKNRRAERLLVPLLDILQSVPILGFISVTVVFFLSLAPGRMLGAEFAAIFAIFTSQAWNMAFSFYQSLRSVPEDLDEAARSFRLTAWARFWRLEVPFAMPPLVWNMMVSMSGGWFFVVAAEAISVGDTTVALPGIGSYIALAIAREDLQAVGFAIGAMLLVILAYDQLLFRPLVAWAERFRFAQEQGEPAPRSWMMTMLRRSWLVGSLRAPVRGLWRRTYAGVAQPRVVAGANDAGRWRDLAWSGAILLAAAASVWQVAGFVAEGVGPAEVLHAVAAGLATMLRVAVLIALASLVWVPVGVWIGLHPRAARLVQPVAQFLAAFPANLLFPVAVSAIVAWRLDPDVWLSPLMILGTQWYILFNVVAGAAAIPPEMRDIATNLRLRGWLWWRRLALPAIFPFYVTGAITASGGSWNASIVAEAVQWGDARLEAFGLGAYIASATAAGDMHRVVLGIAIMSALVVATNRLVWRPLYAVAERRCRMG